MKRFIFLLVAFIAVLGTTYGQKEKLANPEEKSTTQSVLSEEYYIAVGLILADIQAGAIVDYDSVTTVVSKQVLAESMLKDAVSVIDKARTNWLDYKVKKYRMVFEKGEKNLLPKSVTRAYKKGFKKFMASLPKNVKTENLKELCTEENIDRYTRKAQLGIKKQTKKYINTMFTVK